MSAFLGGVSDVTLSLFRLLRFLAFELIFLRQEMIHDYVESNHDVFLDVHQGHTVDRCHCCRRLCDSTLDMKTPGFLREDLDIPGGGGGGGREVTGRRCTAARLHEMLWFLMWGSRAVPARGIFVQLGTQTVAPVAIEIPHAVLAFWGGLQKWAIIL